ncbi:hypothetical protein NP233_g3330 [Leucocoprinus birnbaumii]|uniref:Uncharacterized protein n=1 Tax=Leucocoprinus birnbaumii TaxID=56174 RepID=A0AAD5VWN7_9AGAR|nr:hypothetical protein NP233_g3330 [Leucocoprinus birnbaumii]
MAALRLLTRREEVTEDYCDFVNQKTFKVYSLKQRSGERWIEEGEEEWVKGSIVVLWPKIIALAKKKHRVGTLVGLVTRGKHLSEGEVEGTDHATIHLYDRFYQCFGTIHVACGLPGEIAIFSSETRQFERQLMRDLYEIEVTVDFDRRHVKNGCYDVYYEIEYNGGWTLPLTRRLTPDDISKKSEVV